METSRQLIHLSGLLFVLLAQFTGGGMAAFYFFIIAVTFLIYSEHVRRERLRLQGLLERMEKRLRGFATRFERTDAARPFQGAFWFYMGSCIAFLLFPLPIASSACATLAVGDSLSTVFGKKFGRHMLVGSKTLVGSVAFFAGSVLISLLFVDIRLGLLGAFAAALAELIPDAGPLIHAKRRGIIDDNLLIPVIAGFVMVLATLLI